MFSQEMRMAAAPTRGRAEQIRRYCLAMLPLGTVAPLTATTLSPLVAIVPAP
jgi:hypothetical protein